MAKKKTSTPASESTAVRTRMLQTDLPRHSLREALTVAEAIADNFASRPTAPHQVALALEVSPTSSAWRSLTGAAAAYGLTSAAYNAERISLTDLGRRVTAPVEEGDDVTARAESALKPKVCARFFEKYERAKFPPDHIAKNVLQHDFGVPHDLVNEALTVLKDNGAFVGDVPFAC